MEINELDEKLVPDYLLDENSYLESEILKAKEKLRLNDKNINFILNLKTIPWDNITSIKMASYANVAKLIADARVSQPNSIFYFYTDNKSDLTRINAIKCSELPKYKDNFELQEFICDKIKKMVNESGESNLYYIKGSILDGDYYLNTSIVTCIGSLSCFGTCHLPKIKI